MTISNLETYSEGYGLKWHDDNNTEIKYLFNRPPTSFVILKNKKGLLVVDYDSMPDNAILINVDGSTKTRIKNPGKDRGAIAFEDAYYSNDELTLIVGFNSWQMACVIDDEGMLIRTYETR